jgi:hypothetical protein
MIRLRTKVDIDRMEETRIEHVKVMEALNKFSKGVRLTVGLYAGC